jgi:hypothetical protein
MQTSGDQRREKAKVCPPVIASEAKQSMSRHKERMDCFALLAMTLRGRNVPDRPSSWLRGAPRLYFAVQQTFREGDPSTGQWQFGWLVCIGAIGMQASEPAHAPEK